MWAQIVAFPHSVRVCLRPYRGQLVKAGEEFIQSHHQLLRGALGRQAGETLDVCK